MSEIVQQKQTIEWFKVSDPSSDFPNRGMEVLVFFRPRKRGHRNKIRTAVYYRHDEWFVHGGSDDCGYYDNSFIAAWACQPDKPGWK